MIVPIEVKAKDQVHIFQYSSDLKNACLKLKERLGDAVPITTIDTRGGFVRYGGANPEQHKTIAWLVGHGTSGEDTIGTKIVRDNALSIRDIMDWLNDKKYRFVVDTCCEPNKRRVQVYDNRKLYPDISYFCARDGQQVTENQDEPDLDVWWDKNGMKKIF